MSCNKKILFLFNLFILFITLLFFRIVFCYTLSPNNVYSVCAIKLQEKYGYFYYHVQSVKNYIAVGFRLGIIIIYILYTYTNFKVKKN